MKKGFGAYIPMKEKLFLNNDLNKTSNFSILKHTLDDDEEDKSQPETNPDSPDSPDSFVEGSENDSDNNEGSENQGLSSNYETGYYITLNNPQ